VDCTQIQNLIHAYFDRELDLVRQLEIEHHFPDCHECARAHESLQTLHAGLGAEALYYAAPAGLRERLQAAPRSEAATFPRMRRAASWRWIGLAAAVAALVFLGWGLGQFVRLPSVSPYVPLSAADSRLAQDVVASHVRSLMAAHLVDVQSDNGHVVKPWFIGKVDVAPDVKDDLTLEGFSLVGGRLDYFDNRPVAAIVYRKDKHIINLFLSRSEPDEAETIQSGKLRGYELRYWAQSGVSCWAVSDLNATDLNEFVERLRVP
jgi:anti-sigma factor RsiW